MRTKDPKLVAIFNRFNLKVYSATLKGMQELEVPELPFKKHNRHEKHEGSYHKQSDQASKFDPHTSPEDIEYHDGARIVSHHLEEVLKNDSKWKELIIICDPKMLGHFRQLACQKIQNIITHTIAKNLINNKIDDIKHAVMETAFAYTH